MPQNKYTDDRWNRHNQEIDNLPEDWRDLSRLSYFRQFVVWPLNKNTKVMQTEVDELLVRLKVENANVLEMGAGFGNFCRCFNNKTKLGSYSILDTPSMLRFSKSFLQHHKISCEFISVENYRSLFGRKFDLFVSNICISETPEDYRNDVLDNIWPNCKKLFVIDGDGRPGSLFNDWLEVKVKNHFKKVIIEEMPYKKCRQKNQKLFIGESD